jgi:hypothetical protein
MRRDSSLLPALMLRAARPVGHAGGRAEVVAAVVRAHLQPVQGADPPLGQPRQDLSLSQEIRQVVDLYVGPILLAQAV